MNPMNPEMAHSADVQDIEEAGVCYTCWIAERAGDPPAPGDLVAALGVLEGYLWGELFRWPRSLALQAVFLPADPEQALEAAAHLLERLGIWALEGEGRVRVAAGPGVPDLSPLLPAARFQIIRIQEEEMSLNIHALGIDPGFGHFKVATPEGRWGMVLAAYAMDVVRPMHGDVPGIPAAGRGRRGPAFYRVKVGETRWLVGEIAHLTTPVQRLDPDRFTGTPDMEALLLAAFHRLAGKGEEERVIPAAVVGLPVALMDDRQRVAAVREWIQGEHRGVVNQQPVAFRIERAYVVPQPAGAYYQHILGVGPDGQLETRFLQERVAIVDVGRNTLDIMVFRNGQSEARYALGEQLGTWQAAHRVAQALRISLEAAEALLLERPEDPVVAGSLEQLGAQIATGIQRAIPWDRLGTIDRWILVGGGVLFPPVAGAIRRALGAATVEIPSGALVANAIGMARAALLMDRRRG